MTSSTLLTLAPGQVLKILPPMFKNRRNVLLVGPPGIGKTDVVHQACESLGFNLMVAHPVIDDPTDYKGLAFQAPDGKSADFMPFGNLQAMIDADKPTVVFLDDLGQALPAVQAACMQLLLAREVNGKKISKHIRFAAATNRKEDRAGVSGILEPVKSRFHSILHMDVNTDDWINWAIKNDMPSSLVAFAKFKGDIFDFTATRDLVNSPMPRTVANAGRLVKDLEAEGKEAMDELLFPMVSGAMGEGLGRTYCEFHKLEEQLPNPDLCLQNPKGFKMPQRQDIKFLLAMALAMREPPKGADKRGEGQFIVNLIDCVDRFPADMGGLMMKLAHQKYGNKLTGNHEGGKRFAQWLQKNQDVL